MIFLTVGTTFPFDRLVRAVDEAVEANVITMPVFAQIGQADYKPRHMEYASALEKRAFDKRVDEADFVISHADIASLLIALEQRKRLLVMPRMRRYKEAINDRQLVTARRFAELGHVLTAYDCDELPQRLREMETFAPVFRQSQAHRVVQRLSQFIDEVVADANRDAVAGFHSKHATPIEAKSANRSRTP